MREKTLRLQRLLDEGYSIDGIDSDEASVRTTLRRGASIVVLTFSASEAGDLLYAVPRHPHRSTRGR